MPDVECKMVAGLDWRPQEETQTTINTNSGELFAVFRKNARNESERQKWGDRTVTHIDRNRHRHTHTDRGTATSRAKHRLGSKDETKKMSVLHLLPALG